MKVLLLSQFFDPEPGAGRGLPFARWLQRNGHAVRVLTAVPNYPLGRIYPGYRNWIQDEEKHGIRIRRIPLFASYNRSALRRALSYFSFMFSALVMLFAEPAPDVCYVLNLPTVAFAALVHKWLRGIPYVYNIPDLWPEAIESSGMVGSSWATRLISSGVNAVQKIIYSGAASITVISPGFKELLVERGVPAEKIHVIYNWVDEEVFRPVEKAETPDVSRTDGEFNVLYAGNFGSFQGLGSVVRAGELLQSHPEIRIILAGQGQEEARLKELASQLGLRNVVFLPSRPVAEMPALYARCDALLVHLKDFPQLRTWIPSKTQVSLAVGKPVIIAATGDAPSLISTAGAGIVCRPDDPASIAAAILQMHSSSQSDRQQMAERGRSFYLQHMSLEVGARSLLDVLQTAAGKPECDSTSLRAAT